MLSIGWVMFWKAAVLGVAAVYAAKYRHFRVLQKERGLPTRQRADGVFVVDDKLGRLEMFAKDLRSWGLTVIYAWWVTLAALLFVL